jgi:hypothetical protein
MSVNSGIINNYSNYDLLYIDFNNSIYKVNKDAWKNNDIFFYLEGNNLQKIPIDTKFSKITQIHTGDYIFINNNCILCMCDSNFQNVKLISKDNIFFKGVTQLSNYLIVLIASDGSIYCNKSLKKMNIEPYYNDGKAYASIKQTSDGKVIMVDTSTTQTSTTQTSTTQVPDGVFCGDTYTFDLTKNGLTNKKLLPIDKTFKSRLTIATPDNLKILNMNCDKMYKTRVYKYDFRYNLDISLRKSPCEDDEEFVDGLLCYKKCRNGYNGIATVCWGSCDSGDVDVGALCRNGCSSGHKDVAGVCWKDKALTYDRGGGISPDYGSCNESGLSDVKYYTYTCTGCKHKTWGLCDTYATRDRNKECKSNRQLEDGLCYIKPRDDYTCYLTGCHLSDPSYTPKTYSKPNYDRGVGKTPKTYDPIPCGTNCCSFDLAFINNNFSKPNEIKMMIYSIPLKDELFAFYNADSFLNGVWYDLSTNSNNAVYLKGNIRKVNNYITGDVNSSILFPFDVLPDEYTIFYVCKYNGKSKGKILSGYQSKWSSGFVSGLSGVAIHGVLITQSELSVFDDKWVFSTDTNNMYRANMNDYTTVQNDFKAQTQLSINLNDLPEENSDWAIASIIVFERKLSLMEIETMERWLINRYSNLWSQTYYKTFKQLGYSCFDNKIGKITNNYTKYEFAGYNGEKIDCKWLNYPQKKQIDELSCSSASSNSGVNVEEGFTNTIKSLFDSDFMIKLVILIIILLIVIYNTRKNYKNFY